MKTKFLRYSGILAGLLIGTHLHAATALTGSSAHLEIFTYPDASAAADYSGLGGTVVGNPSISLALETNHQIGRLDFSHTNNSNTFTIAAPIPQPTAGALLAVGSLALLRRNRKHGARAGEQASGLRAG